MFSLAWRWSSFTHAFALSSEACCTVSAYGFSVLTKSSKSYSLRNVVYNHGAVCISVVHGRERLVALLSCCVPDLELDCRLLIEGKGLCEESGADSRFSVVVELVLHYCGQQGDLAPESPRFMVSYLHKAEDERALSDGGFTWCMSVFASAYRHDMLSLTQQHKLELRKSSAAGAAALLHALGHSWA